MVTPATATAYEAMLRAGRDRCSLCLARPSPKIAITLGMSKGYGITNPACALGLASALRLQLREVSMSRLAAIGKNDKMETLYSYLSGPEFRQRVEAIVEAFVDMQKDLEEERRAATRRWTKREKLLQRVIGSTSGMYGDLQGLIGSSLQSIPALSEGAEEVEEADRVQIAKTERTVLREDRNPAMPVRSNAGMTVRRQITALMMTKRAFRYRSSTDRASGNKLLPRKADPEPAAT